MPLKSFQRIVPAAALLGAYLGAGCGLSFSHNAEARDEWTRKYDVEAGATLEIKNANGTIDVREGDGAAINVRAVRIVRTSTDEAAKAALADFTIAESASATRVVLDASSSSLGLTIGLSRRAEFEVTVPRGVAVVLTTANGNITATGLTGRLEVKSTNGTVTASDVSGPVQAETTNGAVRIDLASVAEGGVSCETTNGAVLVTLPRDAAARLSARVSNGGISASGLDLAVSQQSRQRLEATLGGGGPTIRLETTNGAVRINGK
jgi:DUF4097 and DUF4098 domain-containing protein YvlB